MGSEIPRKVVFILGSGHCGSTLLDLMLGAHSRIVGLGEMSGAQPQAALYLWPGAPERAVSGKPRSGPSPGRACG